MKSKTNRSNRWFIIISILVIISMVCGFVAMLRGPEAAIPTSTPAAPSYTTASSRTPQPAVTATPTVTPVADGLLIEYQS